MGLDGVCTSQTVSRRFTSARSPAKSTIPSSTSPTRYSQLIYRFLRSWGECLAGRGRQRVYGDDAGGRSGCWSRPQRGLVNMQVLQEIITDSFVMVQHPRSRNTRGKEST
ncbi:hypothetical protein PC118_g23121 [Phytophthora cactorum]|uniref:Uncharacterized protein n=1 Tax=Phytophthora cactorum TaxID=29920 RepID=A0A8T1AG50_9STRA|nr:hypothetical protein PC112_g23704 [Phytophthora cactorum]KAG2793710.1 hypothetical protein PC111_g22925 [Phytophthora cactorum]KAG2873501.1 hypothetical protein PC114_g25817 [Phytophthora cactorum]KAG2878772.1 hypothetical protein PC115_g22975 [Phytophthora cactorum]KAG2959238.1 hypothetical protein PC118_g23121 [Phytophthora cactorum]